ncbi:hypothetical protein [Vulcanisaeta distributa]|uniref:hypothetical protein n=1 Tax=Vulcanisaeta distributa TaxID=164451 RepID=UPI001FB41C72|nr:hypothetical protein [Vulcanisaeta distributa]
MGRAKHKAWGGGLIDRLKDLGFREYDGGRAINYEVWSSKAVELAKRMLGESSIKALIEDLGLLPDAEKLKNLITLAGMRSKPLVGHRLRLLALG